MNIERDIRVTCDLFGIHVVSVSYPIHKSIEHKSNKPNLNVKRDIFLNKFSIITLVVK